LDIGSASRFYAAKQRGFDVTCVEPDDAMCAVGRSKYGLDMRADTLGTFDAKGRLYDIVTLWGTGSHFENALEGFRKINSILKPSGILAMNYQNFDHPIRLVFPGIKQGFNASYNLSAKSMKMLMDKSGFAIRCSRTEWQQATLGHIAHITKIRIPQRMKAIQVRVYAISFNFVLAERK